jgi:hypothetical protein
MADKQATAAVQQPAKKKHRSPAYPAISLPQAIKRAEEFYKHALKNSLSFNAASSFWEYKPTSSGALLTVAALKHYGLLDELESQSGRTFQLSPLGLRIVADKRPDSLERQAAIKEAALKPKIHAELWRRYNGTLPPDVELEYQLTNKWEFNVNAIPGLIAEFKDTISFAKLTESDIVSVEVEDKDGDEDEAFVPKVGDYVQWESNGVLKLPEPKRVRDFSPDGSYAFVEGSYTGIPVNELIREKAPLIPANVTTSKVVLPSQNTRMQEFVVPLSDGSRAVFQWPSILSKEDVDDLKDSLKILERKISRSSAAKSEPDSPPDET